CCTGGVRVFNDTVTLFCRSGAAGGDTFVRAVLTGVQIGELCGETAARALANAVDRAQLMLPIEACGSYLAPNAWNAMTDAQRAGHFTLQPGDVFVRGEVPDDGTPLSASLGRHGGWKISSVTENGAGSALHHFVAGAGRLWSQTGAVL
ncbi:MAG: hypothetical protein RSA17_10445, partial [Ruthenibacterium sp.]